MFGKYIFMAIHHGRQSEHLKRQSNFYKYEAFNAAAGIYMLAVLTLKVFFEHTINLALIIGALIFVGPIIGFAYLAYRYFKKKQVNYDVGLKGEGSIYYSLLKLTNDYYVFQDVKINRKSNIDFVVLAPTGIFAIEVKANSGRIECNNGKLYVNEKKLRKNIIGQAQGGAMQVKEVLNNVEFVDPVLVFTSINAIIDNSAILCNKVRLVNKNWLINYITSKPRIYTQEQLVEFEKNLLKYVVGAKNKVKPNNINFIRDSKDNAVKRHSKKIHALKKLAYTLSLF
jgi:hypothetical protein